MAGRLLLGASIAAWTLVGYSTELDVTVTRVLQTVTGRMVFAHPRA